MIIENVIRLIVSSTKHLIIYGAEHLDHLMKIFDVLWLGSIPMENPRIQLNHSVGFKRSISTDERFKKLDSFIGIVYDNSYCVASYQMYFSIFTALDGIYIGL